MANLNVVLPTPSIGEAGPSKPKRLKTADKGFCKSYNFVNQLEYRLVSTMRDHVIARPEADFYFVLGSVSVRKTPKLFKAHFSYSLKFVNSRFEGVIVKLDSSAFTAE